MTIVYPHPNHNRLVEGTIKIVSKYRYIDGHLYELTWKDGKTAYYRRTCG